MLKPTDLRLLAEHSKRLHAQQQSQIGTATGAGSGGGSGGGGGGDTRARERGAGARHGPPQSGADEARPSTATPLGSSSHAAREGGIVGRDGTALMTTAQLAAARVDAVNSVSSLRRSPHTHAYRVLTASDVAAQLEAAERVLQDASVEDMDDAPGSLTRSASRKRTELERAREEERTLTTALDDDVDDDRLVASQEAIDAFQRAADAAKRNARRLTAALEREQAMGVGGTGRAMLEQRASAANAAAAALQNRLAALERTHTRKQQGLSRSTSRSALPMEPPGRRGDSCEADVTIDASILAPVSLLMTPKWDAKASPLQLPASPAVVRSTSDAALSSPLQTPPRLAAVDPARSRSYSRLPSTGTPSGPAIAGGGADPQTAPPPRRAAIVAAPAPSVSSVAPVLVDRSQPAAKASWPSNSADVSVGADNDSKAEKVPSAIAAPTWAPVNLPAALEHADSPGRTASATSPGSVCSTPSRLARSGSSGAPFGSPNARPSAMCASVDPTSPAPRAVSRGQRRFAIGEAEEAAARAANSSFNAKRERARAAANATVGSAVAGSSPTESIRGVGGVAGQHGEHCSCLQCRRRVQLLTWRDEMLAAQAHVGYPTAFSM